MFESLTRYLPEIEKAESFGEWIVDNESKGTLDDPIRMPYMNNSALAQDVAQAIYDFQDAYPEYELNRYNSILEKNGLTWGAEAMVGADVSALDGQAVLALLVGAVRADHFSEGALCYFFENDCIERWSKHLQGRVVLLGILHTFLLAPTSAVRLYSIQPLSQLTNSEISE